MENRQKEVDIAVNFLECSLDGPVLAYLELCRLYHGYRYKDKNIRDKIRILRRSFYHDGKKHQIDKFNNAHSSLKMYINSIS